MIDFANFMVRRPLVVFYFFKVRVTKYKKNDLMFACSMRYTQISLGNVVLGRTTSALLEAHQPVAFVYLPLCIV